MNNPISPFEKWRLETIPQVGFTPEIRELLAMAFEGGRQSVAEKQESVPLIRHENGNFSPAPSWQSLSDNEIGKVLDDLDIGAAHTDWMINFAYAIEQALKEKNK